MGCITRTRKAQAPSTLRKTTPPPCPTETGAAGCPASAHAHARASARARERGHGQLTKSACTRERGRGRLSKRAHTRGLPARRVDRTARHVTAPRATCVVRPLVGARPAGARWRKRKDGKGTRIARGAKTIRKEEGTMNTCSTAAARTTRDPRAHHAHPRRADVTGAATARARVARRGVGAKRRRNTRAMTDDGRNANILHHETRTLPTPLLVDRLLAAHEPASSARATPPRRPLARSAAGRGGGGVASCSALLLRPRWCGCRCGRR